MSAVEIILIGIALSMDAFAVGLANGMAEPDMPIKKILVIALFYGGFQFIMPVAGYYGGSALSSLIEKVAPYVSFILLAFIGGKMVYDNRFQADEVSLGGKTLVKKERLKMTTLTAQAIATSIDALAVGVSLLAADLTGDLPFHVVLCAGMIGIVTFSLSMIAVTIGKTAGDKFSDKAGTVGGFVLIVIGLKLLLEGIF